VSWLAACKAAREKIDRQRTKTAKRMREVIEALHAHAEEAQGWRAQGSACPAEWTEVERDARLIIQALRWARGDYGELSPDRPFWKKTMDLIDFEMKRYDEEKAARGPAVLLDFPARTDSASESGDTCA
jgi:hypothetical protein